MFIYHFEIRTQFHGLEKGKYSELFVKSTTFKDYIYHRSREFVSFSEMKKVFRDLLKDVYLKVEPIFYENGLLMDFCDLDFYEIEYENAPRDFLAARDKKLLVFKTTRKFERYHFVV